MIRYYDSIGLFSVWDELEKDKKRRNEQIHNRTIMLLLHERRRSVSINFIILFIQIDEKFSKNLPRAMQGTHQDTPNSSFEQFIMKET